LVEQSLSLVRDLASDPASTGTLIHTDLHYENVLMSEAGEWLAIDPKPLSGDPHFEIAPMLWNRFEELAGDVRAGVRRRFHTIVDAAGLDEERARDWVVVRMFLNIVDALSDRDAGYPEDWTTTCVAIAKAVQD
jgi:streptomycin 6-kinase